VPRGPAPRATIDAGLRDIFEEFSRQLPKTKDTHAEDYERHYTWALALQEMDLAGQAVREFQTAVGLLMPKDGKLLAICNAATCWDLLCAEGLPKPR